MDYKDTFHSFEYKCGTIHVCQNRTQKREEVTYQLPHSFETKTAKSVHAAKLAITAFHRRP